MAGSGAGGMIAGPGSKENGGSAHCSAHGLLAYGAGSCVVVVDVRSMQLVVVLPMPSARTSPMLPAPYVTALQWIPECMSRDLTQEASTSHLRLAVGDRQGRVAIWDTAVKDIVIWLNLETEKGRLGIQDLCWVFGQPWLLAVIHGPSILVIWDPQLARPIWKYDAGTEYLGCIRCDPFDARQVCVVGLKGLLLSLLVQGVSDNDVASKQHHVEVSEERNSGNLGMVGKEGGSSSGSTSAGAPALAAALGAIAKAMFSPRTRGLLYLVFTREIIVFDLNFGMTLGTTPMARGVGRILDVLAVAEQDILYCAHQDGKLSAWIKREDRQAFSMSFTETLIPPMGSPVPAPTVLAVIHCPLQVQVQNIALEDGSTPRLQLDSLPLPGSAPSPTGFIENVEQGIPQLVVSEGNLLEATFVSITDDGRLWQWVVASILKLGPERSSVSTVEPKFKLELTMQLQLLPSAITTLAVPVPSQLGIMTGGSGAGAVAVPMVALATQGGTLELVDAAANAISSSFAVYNSSIVRGVRWLGNSRLISFSYTEVKGKGGGFINKLVVTCVRSGQSKAFREMQKPDRAPMRALRTSPSGRYLIILFREAPAEVWAMTKVPQMLRSLALPFTVMEWALPPAPRSPVAHKSSVSARKPSLFYSTPPTIASTAASVNAAVPAAQPSGPDAGPGATEKSEESEAGESFAFALVNGSLGVFELRGRRVRDFRPKWPPASFVSSDVLVTAMAYRLPHVVMGDRMGNIRWWDVTSGLSSLFNTHRGGVRRIKFAPVTLGDPSRGRIAVLFNDHTFAVYDLDTQGPLANALVHPQLGGILVLELDWFPLRADKHEPLLLCIAGADGSFRLLEIYSTAKPAQGAIVRPSVWQRCRPMPLCSPALLPPPHAMAFRMLLQLGIKASWFYVTPSTGVEIHLGTRGGDLRHFLLESSLPDIGETVAAEVLLKSLETYRRAGRLLDRERVAAYEAISSQGVAARAAFTAAHFGEYAEAVFWLQLPKALALLSIGSAGKNAFWKSDAPAVKQQVQVVPREEEDEYSLTSVLKADVSRDSTTNEQTLSSPESPLSMIKLPFRSVDVVPCEQIAVTAAAQERISWHEKLTGPMATQKRVHEYVSVGDFESAVTLLLSTPPGDENFYLDALRAVSLASAVSPALHELAVKVVAANMVGRDDSLAGTHLLCAVGRYQEACSQLQDAGRWVDASTLAAAHLKGTDHARVLERWAEHVLTDEHNLWRAMILYVAAGALSEALAALRNAQLPDSSALFLLACHEAKRYAMLDRKSKGEQDEIPEKIGAADGLDLPGDLSKHADGVSAVCEYFGQYQRMLAHTVTSISPVID